MLPSRCFLITKLYCFQSLGQTPLGTLSLPGDGLRKAASPGFGLGVPGREGERGSQVLGAWEARRGLRGLGLDPRRQTGKFSTCSSPPTGHVGHRSGSPAWRAHFLLQSRFAFPWTSRSIPSPRTRPPALCLPPTVGGSTRANFSLKHHHPPRALLGMYQPFFAPRGQDRPRRAGAGTKLEKKRRQISQGVVEKQRYHLIISLGSVLHQTFKNEI